MGCNICYVAKPNHIWLKYVPITTALDIPNVFFSMFKESHNAQAKCTDVIAQD